MTQSGRWEPYGTIDDIYHSEKLGCGDVRFEACGYEFLTYHLLMQEMETHKSAVLNLRVISWV